MIQKSFADRVREQEEHDLRAATQAIIENPVDGPALSGVAEKSDLLAFLHNDHGNSQRLIALYGADLRYCYHFRKWIVWGGRRWAVDETGRAEKLAKLTALEFLAQAVQAGNAQAGNAAAERFAKQSLEEKRIRSMLASAQCELPIVPNELDKHHHLLNVANGIINLKTGELLPHDRRYFLTKLVHFKYSPGAECPRFLSFLGWVMGATADASERDLDRVDRMLRYLQKAFGYSLTGSTREKAVFFLYGGGDNGKTTLLATFREIIEEYSAMLQVDTLMVRAESNNTCADIADLRGARFAMTTETEEGQRLAEGKLKRITQGMGKIKTARKYENPFEFPETHKLWFDCNHKPVVRGTDNAIWNRIHAIPFNACISEEEKDYELKAKLMAEAEGILAWGVTGSVEWFKHGLGRPPEVAEAVSEYRKEMDQIGRFISECCMILPTATAEADKLYRAYAAWAEAGREPVISKNAFGRKMTQRGFSRDSDGADRSYCGIGLREMRQ